MRITTATASLHHDPGPGHPERPVRLQAVLDALGALPGLEIVDVPGLDPSQDGLRPLHACHDAGYLEQVAAMSAGSGGDFGPDTPVGPDTWRATLAAAGAALAALEYALSGRGHALAAIRPPGHHALADRGMGFCLVNHVAVLAAEARRRGRDKVLIIDWDVHHGNGTQALVEHEPRTRFVSMHQWPWYPGTGAPDERGAGNCFNVPQPAGLPADVYLEALWGGIVAATREWRPDLILVSAGYDAMRGDPLGGFTLEPLHYSNWIARLRERFPDLPVVCTMEGGYIPARLAAGVTATVEALR